MNMQSILVLVMSLGWMACVAPTETQAETAAVSQSTVTPLEHTAPEHDIITPTDDGPITQARRCQQLCPASTATGESCGDFLGNGRTTFLGSCSKACGFARDDAAAQAQAVGCHLSGLCTGGC